jgi:hypothetical protein
VRVLHSPVPQADTRASLPLSQTASNSPHAPASRIVWGSDAPTGIPPPHRGENDLSCTTNRFHIDASGDISSSFALPCSLVLPAFLQNGFTHPTRWLLFLRGFTLPSLGTCQRRLLHHLRLSSAHSLSHRLFSLSQWCSWMGYSPLVHAIQDLFTPFAPVFFRCFVQWLPSPSVFSPLPPSFSPEYLVAKT